MKLLDGFEFEGVLSSQRTKRAFNEICIDAFSDDEKLEEKSFSLAIHPGCG